MTTNDDLRGLKPCPFCGGDVRAVSGWVGLREQPVVECPACKFAADLDVWSNRAALAEPDSGEVVPDLDARMQAAGMLSVAELLNGAPLDSFTKHAGVHDANSLVQWAEMRRGEYLRMQARYDLGEKPKDDLYEWVIAHCAVFTELHVNLRSALNKAPAKTEPGVKS